MNRISFKFYLYCFLFIVSVEHGQALESETIFGGDVAPVTNFRFEAAIMIKNIYKCSGSIYHENYIITAAHCFFEKNGIVRDFTVDVIVGTHSLLEDDPSKITKKVKRIYVPKKFDPIELTADIALLMLQSSLFINRTGILDTIKLPVKLYKYKPTFVSGFGIESFNWRLKEDGYYEMIDFKSTRKLKYLETEILPNSDCQKKWTTDDIFKSKIIKIDNAMICAHVADYYTGPVGVCGGDSGGPLIYKKRTLVGVLSQSSYDCNDKVRPAVYTRVSAFIDFIQKATKDDKSCYTVLKNNYLLRYC